MECLRPANLLPSCCDKLLGRSLVATGHPAYAQFDTAIIQHESLYTTAGILIENSTYIAGTNCNHDFLYQVHAPRIIDTQHILDSGYSDCLWLGFFHDHFGHFLVSTLQRLWYLRETQAQYEHLITSHYQTRYFSKPFIADIFDVLGINRERLVPAPEKTSVHNITVPEPAFVENSHCYSAWSEFMRYIACRFLPQDRPTLSGTPIFLSRSLAEGKTRVYAGEDRLDDRLKSLGVEICHPEKLSFRDQLTIWNTHSVFIGFSGSSFINAAFFEKKTLIILNHDDYVFGTQRLIDQVSHNEANYLNVSCYLTTAGEEKDNYRIVDVDSLASYIVNKIREVL